MQCPESQDFISTKPGGEVTVVCVSENMFYRKTLSGSYSVVCGANIVRIPSSIFTYTEFLVPERKRGTIIFVCVRASVRPSSVPRVFFANSG
jgi:hypothetical protein